MRLDASEMRNGEIGDTERGHFIIFPVYALRSNKIHLTTTIIRLI